MASPAEQIRSMIEEGRHLIPPYMWGGLERYFVNHVPPGSFLTAVLENDLMEAFARADDTNSENLRKYAQFLYCFAPRGSYGSAAAVRDWLVSIEVAA
jgi:hypothetical protein